MSENKMNGKKIPILDLKPQYESLKKEIDEAVIKVMASTSFIMGPDVKAFEEEAGKYIGSKHVIGVNSGTDALIIGLRAMGIGEGDEVITSPFTFFATAESISLVSAKPVFVDVEEESMNINCNLIEEKITSKTKAIMPVHLFGRPADMSKINSIAKKHNLKVIEDCAQSIGSKIDGKLTGSFGDVGAFSFFPSKNLGAYGDGGMITTDDDTIADTARMLRVHGSKKKYYNEILGYNSRLDTIQAAILRVKLPHLDNCNKERRRVAKTYNRYLEGVNNVIAPRVEEGYVFHQYTIRITNGKRYDLHNYLQEKGISTMIYYEVPIDKLPVYNGQYPECPVSNKLAGEVISLPIWPELEEETIKYIAENIKEFLK